MEEIHWISLITWKTGHGKPLPDVVARGLAGEANAEWPELYHWTVRVYNIVDEALPFSGGE